MCERCCKDELIGDATLLLYPFWPNLASFFGLVNQGVFYYPTLGHFIIELGTTQEGYHSSDPIC